jgi:hypothetical protein
MGDAFELALQNERTEDRWPGYTQKFGYFRPGTPNRKESGQKHGRFTFMTFKEANIWMSVFNDMLAPKRLNGVIGLNDYDALKTPSSGVSHS